MYFDYAATTPADPEVLALYLEVQKKYYANTTSLHRPGQEANAVYEKMKREIRNVLGIDHEIVFTSNATEANNLAIFGITGNKKGKIITSAIEHPSVFNVIGELKKKGFETAILNVDENGIIDTEQLRREMNKDVILVSVMWVNNIIGAIEPISEVIKIVRKYPRAKLHVDAVQGITKIKPDFSFRDIDLFTMSAHKFYGPKGVGVLCYRKGTDLEKRLFGSNVQNGIKPGTIDLALVVCFAKALKKYMKLSAIHYDYVAKLKAYLTGKIKNDKTVMISGEKASPYIIALSVKNIRGETLVHMLEAENIYVSTGSACSSKSAKPEKTVLAVTHNPEYAGSLMRISLAFMTTFEEIDKLADAINRL